MGTRLESECEFLYKIALCHNKTTYTKLISSATPDQLFSIVELAANSSSCTLPLRVCDLRNLKSLRLALQKIHAAVVPFVSCVFQDIVLAEIFLQHGEGTESH